MQKLQLLVWSIVVVAFFNQEGTSQVYILGSGGATGTVTTCSGTFYDPGGLGNYANNLDHSITFTTGDASKVMAIEFTSFSIEFASDCRWDYLDIYDGSSSSAPYLGRYCLNSPGQSVVGSGQSLHFVFHSDGSVVSSGWVGNIYCLDDPCLEGDYEDQFSSANYSNTNGSIDWSSESWIETGDDGSPTGGKILITGDDLRFRDTKGSLSVERDVDLDGASSAVLSFTYDETGNYENVDFLHVEVYDGSVWTRVFTATEDFPNGTKARIDISDYANANTKVKVIGINSESGESYFIEELAICYSTSTSATIDFALEAECGFKGSSWSTFDDPIASKDFYVEPKVGLNSLSSPPADTSDYLTYVVEIDSAGDYELYGRIIAPNQDNESFWVRVNNSTWYKWDDLAIANVWTWNQVWDSDNGDTPISFSLLEGQTRIDIAYREEGTRLDKLFLTLDGGIPSGAGPEATNCITSLEEDTDGDGIANDIDLDDDNDGILDVDESPATIDFGGAKTSLVGSDLLDMDVGDIVLYSNAVRDCNDVLYDITIEINSITAGVQVEASADGMEIDNAGADEDDYFTFTLSVVESGSATVANPSGTAATITDFLFTPRDIDSNGGVDHTEVFGISNATAPDNTFLDDDTVLEQGGFVNGGGPGTGYTYYRMIPLSGATNWTANGNDTTGELEEHAVFMFYNNFSTVDIAYGRTGSAPSSNNGRRLTSLFASKECDRDMDGVPNTVDLDLDNDGIFDLHEAGHGELDLNDDGRIDGADTGSGSNGIYDGIETAAESGVLNYTYSDSDGTGIEDPFDIDSDDDGCFDTEEADVSDTDVDGTAGSGIPSVDANGLVVSIIYDIPPTTAWQDATASCLEDCDNGLDDDGDGDVDDDDADCANYYLEAECGFPGENWDRGFDVLASNDDYLTISPGFNSTVSAPTDAADLVRFTVNVSAMGLYRILARVYSDNGGDDSFWVRVDEGTWYPWNDWNTASTWQWLPFSDNNNGNTLLKFSLSPGNHTIDIAYREDGARIDKLHLTVNGTTPSGDGEDAINCGRTITYNLFLPYKILNRN